jgi:outer membrane lipoprotein carrier protein
MIVALALALALAAPPQPAPAPPATAPGHLPRAERDAAAIAREVQGYYDATRDFEAKFTQRYTYVAFGRTQVSSGTLRMKKPGKLRWDYLEPTPKTIVVNGTKLVQFEPEANQAYVDERFDTSALSAAVTFLLGKGSLAKEFDLGRDGADGLVLTPKREDARVARVVLTVAPGGQVTASRVEDGQGNVNELRFEGLKRNVGLKDDAFVLDLPKDVHRVKAPGGG